MLKAVIFDIDNTLYDYDAAHAPAFQALTEYARDCLSIPAEDFPALHRQAERTLAERCGPNCAALHNRLLRYQALLEARGLPLRHAPVMSRLYWETLLDAMAISEGAAEAMDALRQRGLRIGICTNMTADCQFEKLIRLELIDRVDFIVTSEEVTAEKPDKKIFDCCAAKAGCASSECAFVGDNREADALGAIAAGMKGVWLRRADQPDREVPGGLRIHSLKELPDAIASLER